MNQQEFDIVYEKMSLLGKDMAKAEDEMFFVGFKKTPEWAKAGAQKMTWKTLKFKVYLLFMDKTKPLRWKVAKWFAPDIHDYCDY